MKISQQIFACLFLLALAVRKGLALECYSCNSFVHKDACLKPGPDTPVVECGVNQTMCRKVEQEMYYNGDDHTRVFRQCATTGELGDCKERTGTYRFKSYYCHCQGPRCNGAESVMVSISVTVGMVFAVLGLRKVL